MERALSVIMNKSDQNGVVLVEFAFCCPVLIILLFFVLDIPLAYRVVTKMQKMSELTSCMIRNVPNKNNTLITIQDLKNISMAAGVYLTGRLGSSSNPCKHYPFYLSTYIFCVEGNSSGGFDKKWNVHIKNNLYNGSITVNKNDTTEYSRLQNANTFLNVNGLENFSIHEGEMKLIVETVAWYNETESSSMEGVPINGQVGSGMFGDYGKNKSRVRGYNKNFYLITIPGRSVKIGEKAFGNGFSIMSYVDEIVDPDECPE